MLVCRQWTNVIRSTCLYSSVVISKTGVVDRFVEILEEQKYIRKQVNELTLLGNVRSNMNEMRFYKLFPSLSYIHFGCVVKMGRLGHTQNNGRSISLKYWSDQMQTVRIYSGSKFMYTLLTPSTCSSLAILSIGPHQFNEDNIERLANATRLQVLTIFDCKVSTSHVERVYGVVPALQLLRLVSVHLVVDNDADPINTADSLKTVYIRYTNTNIEIILKWIKYVSMKYINIFTFSYAYDGRNLLRASDEDTLVKSGILPALQKLCYLKRFKTICPISIATLFHAIDATNSKIEEFKLIVHCCWALL